MAPPVPSSFLLSVVGSVVTFTVYDSDTPVVNEIYYQPFGSSWVKAGEVVNDGSFNVTLEPGSYWAGVRAVNEGGSSWSILSQFRVMAEGETGPTPSQIFKGVLIVLGLGDDVPSDTWPIYIGSMPDGLRVPENLIAVYDTEGVKDNRNSRDRKNKFYNGIQIRVRSIDYVSGFQKMEEITNLLEKQSSIEQEGRKVYAMIQATEILSLGQEEGTKRRYMFSCNYLLGIKEV